MWGIKTCAALLALLAGVAHAFNPRVHAFYYLWYGNPAVDGRWVHWNHTILPHWDKDIRKSFAYDVPFQPPYDLHSPFYPQRGPYSSRNATLLYEHMHTMLRHGIGVAVISWWGRPEVSGGDSQGVVTDAAVRMVLEAAAATGMKIAFHLEPYEGRSVESIREDLEYLHTNYLSHPAIYKHSPAGKHTPGRPVFYVYDSYHIDALQWERLLLPGRDLSVRETELDGYFVALWLDYHNGPQAAAAGFEAGYTYFAAEGMTYGSSVANWPLMSQYSKNTGFVFIPSVGPGYDDSKIRPWNTDNTRPRGEGQYYSNFWNKALEFEPEFVSITSFNEWGEGTQIEEAVPFRVNANVMAPAGECLPRQVREELGLPEFYQDYKPGGPDAYLKDTKRYSIRLARRLEVPVPDDGDLVFSPPPAAPTPAPTPFVDPALVEEQEAVAARRAAMLEEEALANMAAEEQAALQDAGLLPDGGAEQEL